MCERYTHGHEIGPESWPCYESKPIMFNAKLTMNYPDALRVPASHSPHFRLQRPKSQSGSSPLPLFSSDGGSSERSSSTFQSSDRFHQRLRHMPFNSAVVACRCAPVKKSYCVSPFTLDSNDIYQSSFIERHGEGRWGPVEAETVQATQRPPHRPWTLL